MALNSKNNKRRPMTIWNTWHLKLVINKLFIKLAFLSGITNSLANFFSSSVILGIITLVQLAAGAILGANISLSFTSSNYSSLGISDLSIIIWSGIHSFTLYTVSFAVFLTLLRALADSYVSTQRQKLAIKLAKEQRSLPDSLWLRNYHKEYVPTVMTINNAIKQSFDSGDFDDVEIKKHITTLLEFARDMALSWDSNHKEGYAANLMLYAPSTLKIATYIKAHWNQNHMFFDANNPYSVKAQISGILYVAASANSETTFYGRKENEKNPPLILPVCLDEDLNTNKYLSKQRLPGAPEAFRLSSYYYTENLLVEIERWLNEDCWSHFSESQAQEIYERYKDDHSSRSLVSIPVKLPTHVQNIDTGVDLKKGSIVAVLNVYSQNTRMLRGNASDFNEFCRPLVSTLALCIAAYEIWTNLPPDENDKNNVTKESRPSKDDDEE
ncbi:hypothetical protein [Vibrio splendidus]|uniref:Uncharacterized protein n=1 Tax=Vibrio splendidus TaxID=29497 RepID=A0A7Y4D528_VIBSP|nr:hypothetical protein [Vibrio splendidus]NOJ12764.1 hypothetical protein [Vibrio splendidus]